MPAGLVEERAVVRDQEVTGWLTWGPDDPLGAGALNWFVMNPFSLRLVASSPATVRSSSVHPVDRGKYCSVLSAIRLLLFLSLFIKGGSQINRLCCR